MSTLTLAEAKAFIETDLSDTALQMLIDSEEAEIVYQIGAIASQVDDIVGENLSNIITLTRRASSITSIVEKVGSGTYTSTTLASNDYSLRHYRILERLSSGTNQANTWGNIVTVTYVPVDDTARRKMVTVDLIKLAIVYNGLDSKRTGDYSEAQKKDYQAERERIISRLRATVL